MKLVLEWQLHWQYTLYSKEQVISLNEKMDVCNRAISTWICRIQQCSSNCRNNQIKFGLHDRISYFIDSKYPLWHLKS